MTDTSWERAVRLSDLATALSPKTHEHVLGQSDPISLDEVMCRLLVLLVDKGVISLAEGLTVSGND